MRSSSSHRYIRKKLYKKDIFLSSCPSCPHFFVPLLFGMWFRKALMFGIRAAMLRWQMDILSSHWGYVEQRLGWRQGLSNIITSQAQPRNHLLWFFFCCCYGNSKCFFFILSNFWLFCCMQQKVFQIINPIDSYMGQDNTSSCYSRTPRILVNRFESLDQRTTVITHGDYPKAIFYRKLRKNLNHRNLPLVKINPTHS